MIVDPARVRTGEIDGTEENIPEDTRRAIRAYHVAHEKPGGSTRAANLIQALFELYPAATGDIARESGTLANLTRDRVRGIRDGLADEIMYRELAEICHIFEVDYDYLKYPRATEEERDAPVARARAFRAENPHLEPNEILRGHLMDYANQARMGVSGLVDMLCTEVWPHVRVPDPNDVEAFLKGLDCRPQFLDAAGDLLGYTYCAWMELWGNGWWRNDLHP